MKRTLAFLFSLALIGGVIWFFDYQPAAPPDNRTRQEIVDSLLDDTLILNHSQIKPQDTALFQFDTSAAFNQIGWGSCATTQISTNPPSIMFYWKDTVIHSNGWTFIYQKIKTR